MVLILQFGHIFPPQIRCLQVDVLTVLSSMQVSLVPFEAVFLSYFMLCTVGADCAVQVVMMGTREARLRCVLLLTVITSSIILYS